MLRNTPTAGERFKMQNSGMSLDQVRAMQDQQTMGMRMGAGRPVPGNNIFGNQMNDAAADLMQARAAGSDGQDAISRGRSLAPMVMTEQFGRSNPEMFTPPREGSSGGRMAAPSPDPFAPSYQPKRKGDPFGPLPPRPRGFAMGGLVNKSVFDPRDTRSLPTPEELSQQMGGQPFNYSYQGPTQFSPLKDMQPKFGQSNAEGFRQFADGGPVIGPGGHK
jgi:hypothetical protein